MILNNKKNALLFFSLLLLSFSLFTLISETTAEKKRREQREKDAAAAKKKRDSEESHYKPKEKDSTDDDSDNDDDKGSTNSSFVTEVTDFIKKNPALSIIALIFTFKFIRSQFDGKKPTKEELIESKKNTKFTKQQEKDVDTLINTLLNHYKESITSEDLKKIIETQSSGLLKSIKDIQESIDKSSKIITVLSKEEKWYNNLKKGLGFGNKNEDKKNKESIEEYINNIKKINENLISRNNLLINQKTMLELKEKNLEAEKGKFKTEKK